MAYKSNIPQPTDQLSISQPDLLGNFTEIANMLDLTTNSNALKFPRVVVKPATAATTVSIFGADSADSPGNTALYFRPQNQAIAGTAYDFTTASLVANGWCRLPCGLMMIWGSDNTGVENPAVDSYQFNMARAFPTAGFTVIATPNSRPAGLNDDNIIAISFVSTIRLQVLRKTHYGTSCSFNYLALGY